MQNLLVKDWMTTDVITASPKTQMLKAHKLMREKNIRRMPIVNKRGQLKGIVTRSDIRKAQPSEATTLTVWEINYLLSQMKLGDIMTRDVVTIAPTATIKEAAIRMHNDKIGALPVVENGKLVGIITESDIFRVLVAWYNEERFA